MSDPRVRDIARALRFDDPVRERVLHVDLDHVHDDDPAQAARNLDALIERVATLGPSHVYLQAYADPDGDGVAEALYFPNRHLPVRADLFNRVAWQLSSRAGVQVRLMPVLARDSGTELVFHARHAGPRCRAIPPADALQRPQPRNDRRDLRGPCQARGLRWLLFHDDAFLSDFEDASPAALAAYRAVGLPGDIAAIRADPAAMARWTTLKTQALIDLTTELTQRALRLARRSPPRHLSQPVLNPAAQACSRSRCRPSSPPRPAR